MGWIQTEHTLQKTGDLGVLVVLLIIQIKHRERKRRRGEGGTSVPKKKIWNVLTSGIIGKTKQKPRVSRIFKKQWPTHFQI